MPTDDDYGRRERLLLQHQTGQYGQPGSPLRSSATGTANGKSSTSSNTSSSSSGTGVGSHEQYSRQPISQGLYSSRYDQSGDHHHLHHSSYQQLSSVCDRSHGGKKTSEYANLAGGPPVANPFSGTETFLPSPPSPAPAGSDRFVPPPPLSPSVSDKYSSSQSLANYHPGDRHVSANSASAQQPGVPGTKEQQRFSSTDRLLAGDGKDTRGSYTGSSSSTERLLASASPVLGVLSERCPGGPYKDSSVSSSGSSSGSIRYGISSTERLLSSSPIHAPVPEKFANSSSTAAGAYFKDSPLHERYHQQAGSGAQHYSGPSERYSPNPPEAARYSTSGERRYSTDQALEAASQKYAPDSRASPGPTEFASGRYQGYQESGSGSSQRYGTSDRFNDLALQRYAQNSGRPPSDRFLAGNDRYMSGSSAAAHDARQSGGCELSRLVENPNN